MGRQKQDIEDSVKQQIIELFLDEGMSFKDIGAKTNIAPAKISALIKSWDIHDPRKTILAKFPTKDAPQDRNMLAYQVYKRFPNAKFWEVMRLTFPLNSLKYFLDEETGVPFIQQYIREFETPAPERKTVEISPTKIGEDYVINKKITRKDFLK